MPDERGETRAQAPVSGLGVDLFSAETPEWTVLNLREALVRGRLPRKSGEMLIGEDGARKLHISPGDTATIISSTMNGRMSVANYAVVGTLRFGVSAMDRGTVIVDVGDARRALDMEGGAGEILGFFRDDIYHEERAGEIAGDFNSRHAGDAPFSPVMGTLRSQSGLADYLDYVGVYSGVIMGVFVLAMSVVLWNAGLTGSLRRYGEMGIRLAVGEDKRHIYLSLLAESLAVGVIGSVLGTAAGLAIAWYGEAKGLDLGSALKGSTIMYPNLIRARIVPFTFVVGFIPGLIATFLGTAISGVGIYRRQTSELFKELES
jgi:putative ABC transport system permease protein